MLPDEILTKIHQYVGEYYGADLGYSQNDRNKEIEREIDAYNKYVKLYESIPINIADEIKIYCDHEPEDSWSSTLDSYEKEVSSYNFIISFKDDEIDEFTIKRLINAAKIKVNQLLGSGEYSVIRCEFEDYLKELKIRRSVSCKIEPLRELLIDIEEIIASECYNDNIQNHWGEDLPGRNFRYPITFSSPLLEKKEKHVPSRLPTDDLILGKYTFGANHLFIYKALINVIQHIENKYEISFTELNNKKNKERLSEEPPQ